jgi:hypothetical protein
VEGSAARIGYPIRLRIATDFAVDSIGTGNGI